MRTADTASINGCELYYESEGAGDPLVMLHGFGGSGADWDYVFTSPIDGYMVIRPDLRGHGRSTNPSREFTFRQAAADVFSLLDCVGIRRFRGIGLSGGANTLLHIATAQPARVESMVVVSAPPYFPAQARALMAQFSEDSLPPHERDAMRRRHKHGEAQLQMLFAQARGFADSYEDVNFDRQALSTITARTLIVYGDRDPFYPVELALQLYGSIPSSFLWVVPNAGHGPIFGPLAPQFAKSALEFLGS